MQRIRRPWPISQRDTEGVPLDTLDQGSNNVEVDERGKLPAEKTGFDHTTGPVDFGHGHLQEIEVELDQVIQDREVKDIGSDSSPYPEVRAVVPEVSIWVPIMFHACTSADRNIITD